MSERNLEIWPIERLRPYDRNPRTHSPAQIEKIAASLREFGWTNPILADPDGGVVAGHGRLEAARKLGLGQVPVIVLAGLTEAQRRAYVIADNQLALQAGWDSLLLSGELQALQAQDFDLGLLGFDPAALAELLSPPRSTNDAEPRIDEAEALRERWGVVPGQVWGLGQHRILCGDSTKPEDVSRLMAGEQADCLWTDPPYNVDYKGAAGKIANDKMGSANFKSFLDAVFAAAFSVMREGAPAYVSHSDAEGVAFRTSFVEAGFKLSSCLVWKKNAFVLGRMDFQQQHEPVLYGWKPGGRHTWVGGRNKASVVEQAGGPVTRDADGAYRIEIAPGSILVAKAPEGVDVEFAELHGSVIRVDRPRANHLHPTIKPIELIKHMLGVSTLPTARVLDLFGGSGSTLVACEHLGRCARLVELDPKFVAVAIQRYVDATGGAVELLA